MTGHAPYELAWAGNHTALHDWMLEQVCHGCTGPNTTTPSGPDVSWRKSIAVVDGVPVTLASQPKAHSHADKNGAGENNNNNNNKEKAKKVKKKKKKKKEKQEKKKKKKKKKHPADKVVASNKVVASERSTDTEKSLIPVLDASAQALLGTSAEAAFVMYHPAHCDGCSEMGKFWDMVHNHYPSRIYEIFCDDDASDDAETRHLCERFAAPDPRITNPLFLTWQNQRWEQYAGEKNPRALLSHIQGLIGLAATPASPVVPAAVRQHGSQSPQRHVAAGDWEDAEEDGGGEKEECLDERPAVRQCDQVGMYGNLDISLDQPFITCSPALYHPHTRRVVYSAW